MAQITLLFSMIHTKSEWHKKFVKNETIAAKYNKLWHHDCFCFENDAAQFIVLPIMK